MSSTVIIAIIMWCSVPTNANLYRLEITEDIEVSIARCEYSFMKCREHKGFMACLKEREGK